MLLIARYDFKTTEVHSTDSQILSWIETEAAQRFPNARKKGENTHHLFIEAKPEDDVLWWMLTELTYQGWEPFGIDNGRYYLRKQYDA